MDQTAVRPHKTPKIVLLCIVGMGLLLAVGIGMLRSIGMKSMAHRLETLRSRGDPISIEDLEAWYSVEPNRENAASLYLTALDRLAPSLLDLHLVEKQLPLGSQTLEPATTRAIEDVLAESRDLLNLLHQAGAVTYCRYPLDLKEGRDPVTQRLPDFQTFVLLLSLQSLIHAERDNPDRAFEDLQAAMAVTESLDVPLLAHRMAMNLRRIDTVRAMQRVLNRTALSLEQLNALSEPLAAWLASDGLARPLSAERCYAVISMQHRLRTRLGLSFGDVVTYIDLMQENIDIARLPAHDQIAAAQSLNLAARQGAARSPVSLYCNNLIAVAHARAAYTALAVERYCLANGEPPLSIESLVPRYMTAIPSDPFDGSPMRYQRLERGLVVYSVGPDRRDDRGQGQPRGVPFDDIAFAIERAQQ